MEEGRRKEREREMICSILYLTKSSIIKLNSSHDGYHAIHTCKVHAMYHPSNNSQLGQRQKLEPLITTDSTSDNNLCKNPDPPLSDARKGR